MESASNKVVAKKNVGSDLYFLLHLHSLTAFSLTLRSKSTLQTSADDSSQSCLLTSEMPYHQQTGITISHHPLTALKLKKPHGGKQQQQNPGPQVRLNTQHLSRKWLNRKVLEVFSHPADTRRSQANKHCQIHHRRILTHEGDWNHREALQARNMKCSHVRASHWVNAAKAVSHLGSRYETDGSSHRPTPPWSKISSNHSSPKKGERTLTLPKTPSLQLWYLSPARAITWGHSHCQFMSPVFHKRKMFRLDQSKKGTANLLRPGGKSFLWDSDHATQLLQQVYKPCNW